MTIRRGWTMRGQAKKPVQILPSGMALGNLVYSSRKKAEEVQNQCRLVDGSRICRQEMDVKQHVRGQEWALSSHISHSADNYWTTRNTADSKSAIVFCACLFRAVFKELAIRN